MSDRPRLAPPISVGFEFEEKRTVARGLRRTRKVAVKIPSEPRFSIDD